MSTAFRKAIWWTGDYAYAAWWQVRGAVSRIPADAFHSGNRSPVVVIPGVYESWQFLLPLITALHKAGHPVHVVTLLQRNRLDVPIAARLVAEHIAAAGLDNAVIVAHSKGGLIGKYIMLALDPDRRVDRLVAVCTPFSGSRYARYLLIPSLRAFSPGNALTLQMAREETINNRITSIYGLYDPHIPEGSVLPGARNIRLQTVGHFRILGDAQTARTIVEQIQTDPPDQ
ncbi:alpha/beta hydrolase [Arthrobacter sp. ES3-54]|uniref:esterase/lipase family protein n=1 Tax=Arthrobacter sp. ES3-54 TaxID=1502991 RepID=UPI0024066398|nr:alpha/beta hydrolase [Arthrobacter sp. ES3-54]MDF9750445.1 hypothetical protein [Arthrobacter sp. ES3-54]